MSTTAARHSAASHPSRPEGGTQARPTSTKAVPGDSTPIGLEDARELVQQLALDDLPVGTVGVELEGHAIVWRDPSSRPPFEGLEEVAARLADLPAGGRTTLEPGGQVEVSSAPHPDIGSALVAMAQDTAHLRAALAGEGWGWALLGSDPLRPPQRVNPAERYAAMERFFASSGDTRDHGATMMCSTAALQVNLQPGHPDQWTDRVRRAQRLGPLLTALSGSSAYLAGRDTGWHSARQRAWTGLGELRAGPIDDHDPARAWAERALEAPVVLVPPEAAPAPDGRGPRSLRDWLTDPGEWPVATAADVRRQLTTLFPPVRLRGWLELRCLDSLPDRWWPAVAALTTTWMDVEAIHPDVDRAIATTADRWHAAASDGLGDASLRRAAATCLEAALSVVPEGVRPAVEELTELARTGRSPGTLIVDDLRRRGPAVVLEEMSHV
ncbi:glutamate-cysteine ligase family protein [Pedococcus sp. KACC 23699]|uniref:Glutamate--cysteine ligase EgtA n=1 Tax=Pedococcus sp. KACC 23699 TaxID=3149228 RepID=A0AAU7JU83_9MICO